MPPEGLRLTPRGVGSLPVPERHSDAYREPYKGVIVNHCIASAQQAARLNLSHPCVLERDVSALAPAAEPLECLSDVVWAPCVCMGIREGDEPRLKRPVTLARYPVKMTRGPYVALEPLDPVLCLLRFAKRDDFFVSHRVGEGAFWCLVRRCFICDKPSACGARWRLRFAHRCARSYPGDAHLQRVRPKTWEK